MDMPSRREVVNGLIVVVTVTGKQAVTISIGRYLRPGPLVRFDTEALTGLGMSEESAADIVFAIAKASAESAGSAVR